MWIQVRSMDGLKSARVDELSKLTKIEDLRKKIEDKFDAPPERQRLFYRGKQLEDGHTLFDYDVGLNDIIQILVRPTFNEQPISSLPKSVKEEVEGISSSDESTGSNKENKLDTGHEESSTASRSVNRLEPSLSKYFQIGSLVDAKDISLGAWFEAKILNIYKGDNMCEVETDNSDENVRNSNKKLEKRKDKETDCVNNVPVKEKCSNLEHNGSSGYNSGLNAVYQRKTLSSLGIKDQGSSDALVYEVMFEDYEEEEPLKLRLSEIRPRARTIVKFDDIKVDETYMVNYNIEEPDERGYWYDCLISKKKNTRTVNEIYGTIYMGSDLAPLDNCKVVFTDEVFKIEDTKEIDLSSERSDTSTSLESPVKRQVKPDCSHCKDIASRKCRFCNCHICGGKDEPGKQIMCDECDMSYHIWCLTPPLADIPDDEEWYCPECKNDETEVVRAGEKLKKSKKKAKMASANSASNRDWGKGMACVGRTKECTLVPPNHFGSIPGIEVGMMWKFRVQGSEAGVHRPHVAGIHGRENEGSYSIVLAGGYEDDADNGEEFFYTGSGGRDLSGNKRTAEQSCDQTLTRMNKALALNCAAQLNDKTGAEAKNWKEGKPVRVVRSSKGKKHSKYCPEDGIRYDGIYKVVKYWAEKGKSGFLVWRYLLRRDDPAPAPWSKAGKLRIKELGLKMQYPEGYLEIMAEKEKSEQNGKKGKGKRSQEGEPGLSPKKKKSAVFRIPEDISKFIKEDKLNQKLWNECKAVVNEGQQVFLKKIEELFLCICCQEVVFQPVTTDCLHNICKVCLQRSFQAEVYSCPACRKELGKNYHFETNKFLSEALHLIFPGYEASR